MTADEKEARRPKYTSSSGSNGPRAPDVIPSYLIKHNLVPEHFKQFVTDEMRAAAEAEFPDEPQPASDRAQQPQQSDPKRKAARPSRARTPHPKKSKEALGTSSSRTKEKGKAREEPSVSQPSSSTGGGRRKRVNSAGASPKKTRKA